MLEIESSIAKILTQAVQLINTLLSQSGYSCVWEKLHFSVKLELDYNNTMHYQVYV